jgi:hypothetical protein
MRIDVRHRDAKGLEAIVGAVVIFVLTRLWVSGELATWLALITGWFRGVESSGFSSATYAIVELVTSLVYGVGAVVILAWSGILWVVRDVAAAIKLYRESRESVVSVTVDDPPPQPASDPQSDPIIDAIETIAGAVKDISQRLDAIEAPPKAVARGRKPSA